MWVMEYSISWMSKSTRASAHTHGRVQNLRRVPKSTCDEYFKVLFALGGTFELVNNLYANVI